MSGLVAIHQPNFFPWLGFFDKAKLADVFVLFDAVQLPKSGAGSWTNRVKIKVHNKEHWLTCPIKRNSKGRPINEAEINNTENWRARMLRTLEFSYGRAANYKSTFSFLEPLIANPESNLVRFNEVAIRAISERLGITTRFVKQSELAYSGQATGLLISLVKAVGGDAYLTGGGADGYQQDDMFAKAGIGLVHQNFIPVPYGPPERFIPGLSVIDYLMHDGRPLAAGNDRS